MKVKIIKSEYVVSDDDSGVEINVKLEVDYQAKTFKVNSVRKDGNFVFNDNLQSPERVMSIGSAIKSAAIFAKTQLEGSATLKETIEAFTQ